MLIGEYIHTLDPKKRLALPAKLRKELGGKAVITRGLDKCLYVFPLKEWEKFAASVSNLPMGQSANRSFERLFLSGAMEVETDGLGRILIPDYLKDYAELKSQAAIVGVYFFAGFLFLLGFWPLWKNGLLQSNWFWAALFVSFIGLYWAAEEAFGIILDRAEKRARDKLKEKEKKG